jgi:thiol-disulfide isomerase/thioredoxin
MIFKKRTQQHTTSRAAASARVLGGALSALALLAGSACTSNDTANETAANRAQANKGKPSVTVTAQRGAPQQQPQTDRLSAEIMNAQIQALDGEAFRLADFNDKVIVLDLWATWCGPCRLEIPHLVELSKEYAPKNVEVIGLTTENPETHEETVRAFAKEFKINYRLGWADASLALGLTRGRNTIPQTFVIAPGGRVVAHIRGFSPQLPTMIRAAIDKATAKTGD